MEALTAEWPQWHVPDDLIEWSTFAAVGFGSLSGAAFAARRGFDVIGVLGLAIAQGMGGLMLAPILLQTGTPEVLTDGRYLVVVSVAAALGFFFAGLIARAVSSALLIDALSLGLLVVIGAGMALDTGLDNIPAVFIAVMTAVGGLILRDVLAGRPPEVLRPGIFVAFAALIGAVAYIVLVDLGVSSQAAQWPALAVVAGLRILSVRQRWRTREATDLTDRVWSLWQRSDRDPTTSEHRR